MTPEQIDAFLTEMERRWRSRTPATDPNYSNPDYRVGRSEMVTWFKDTYRIELSLPDTVDPELLAGLRMMWRRLRREFSNEAWDAVA